MTAAMSDPPPAGGWTTDDLDALPEDGVRRELLDGVLHVSPSRTDIHQIIAARLMVSLEASCPAEFQVTQGVEVRISPRRSFITDVLVATDTAAQRRSGRYAPHEVVLAVEIVSPTSTSMDRITKPALFAAAGIPYYWRIELLADRDGRGIEVHTCKIDSESEMYRPFGTFNVEIDTVEPWPIKIPIAKLTPRYL
jgi:Uma2 family endonuclease